MEDNPDIDDSLRYEYLSNFIHYGSVVHISLAENVENHEFEDNNEFESAQKILHCDGFISRNLILHDIEKSSDDFEGSLFRIIPPYSYEIQKQMTLNIRSFEENDGDINMNSNALLKTSCSA